MSALSSLRLRRRSPKVLDWFTPDSRGRELGLDRRETGWLLTLLMNLVLRPWWKLLRDGHCECMERCVVGVFVCVVCVWCACNGVCVCVCVCSRVCVTVVRFGAFGLFRPASKHGLRRLTCVQVFWVVQTSRRFEVYHRENGGKMSKRWAEAHHLYGMSQLIVCSHSINSRRFVDRFCSYPLGGRRDKQSRKVTGKWRFLTHWEKKQETCFPVGIFLVKWKLTLRTRPPRIEVESIKKGGTLDYISTWQDQQYRAMFEESRAAQSATGPETERLRQREAELLREVRHQNNGRTRFLKESDKPGIPWIQNRRPANHSRFTQRSSSIESIGWATEFYQKSWSWD